MELEKDDIQGLVVRGYSGLTSAAFSLLKFGPADKAKGYLTSLAELVTKGSESPQDHAIHVAFTHAGIEHLGLHQDVLQTFSRQFIEGMNEESRQFVLGDIEDNAPEHWDWGAPHQEPVHMLLLFYAKDDTELKTIYDAEKRKLSDAGIAEIKYLETQWLPKDKEHFGFRDGLSQPLIEGLSKSESIQAPETIPAGEFILGYPNWYNQYPDSPELSEDLDPAGILTEKTAKPGIKDLGRNGSYLVLRQLRQDVAGFWDYMKNGSSEAGTDQQQSAIALASKMVGRWPSGAPLILSPDEDKPEMAANNQFGYWNEDYKGLKCPVGAHIRRTNPRDWLRTEKTSTDSSEMVQKHRLLRRGRTYGPPVDETMEPTDIMQAGPDNKERGLHFICFMGDIIRQFEFVQNAWVRFHKFGGLYADSDPLIGTHYQNDDLTTNQFTVPAKPIRRRYKDLPQFVHLKGGAYFFFPGIRAIRYLASI